MTTKKVIYIFLFAAVLYGAFYAVYYLAGEDSRLFKTIVAGICALWFYDCIERFSSWIDKE